ncbi:hypothetical protein ABZ297_00185 [Nonomuraea sp. NPDC005983]|uniref:hypothetical protein n=1 Tax=Nonomuraea sp. NPDC005983 TaxID=3155595 RepID=UPI0033B13D97
MRAGYGSADLTVPEGTPMGGYLDRPGPSTGHLDPLRVSAITWFDGERRFALATADVICVNEDLAAQARRALSRPHQPGSRAGGCGLWLAASHTHAGPETGCVPGGGPTPEAWLERIVEATRAAVQQAIDGEKPGEGEVYRGDLHGVGADRSRPSAAAVVPLDLVAVRDAGRLAGVLVVLPVHPTVLPAANRLASADLVGAVRRSLQTRLGPAVWVVVATGAAGDISTRHTRNGQDTAELDRLGAIVADRCLELLQGRPARAWSATSRISWSSRRVTLARANAPADLATLTTAFEQAQASGDPVATRLARSRLEGVHSRTGGIAPIGADVNVARLGDLALVGLPGEPFLAVGESIAEERRGPDAEGRPTVVLGYVNGYPGYLPTIDAYERTEYEVLASQVAPGSAELLAETALHLLEEM